MAGATIKLFLVDGAPHRASMHRRLALIALLALAGCGGGLSDAQRVWCGQHPMAVVTAGESLRIPPSPSVEMKAAIEQASLDGNTDLATQLILERVGQSVTGPGVTDPHPDLGAMASWEADAPTEWQRACVAARDAEQ